MSVMPSNRLCHFAVLSVLLISGASCAPSSDQQQPSGPPKPAAVATPPGQIRPPAGAVKLCGGHVTGALRPDGTPGPHITWDAYSSRELLETLVKGYTQTLGAPSPDMHDGCNTWRIPPGKPAKVFEICSTSAQGPWTTCSSISPDAQSVIIISSIAGAD